MKDEEQEKWEAEQQELEDKGREEEMAAAQGAADEANHP